MAKQSTFRCSVITPEASILEADAEFAAFPAHDGQIGILRNRAPLLCKLGIGELRLDTAEGRRQYFIDGGFAQMVHNNLIILTQQAVPAEDLDPEQARKDLADASASRAQTLEAQEARRQAQQRARAKLRIAKR
jgi:F-type H+-transporting ATPase subunit epsilon